MRLRFVPLIPKMGDIIPNKGRYLSNMPLNAKSYDVNTKHVNLQDEFLLFLSG